MNMVIVSHSALLFAEGIANQCLSLSPGETERFGQLPARGRVQRSRNKYDPIHNPYCCNSLWLGNDFNSHFWGMPEATEDKKRKQAVSTAATAKQNKLSFILKLCQSRFRKLTRQNGDCKLTRRCDKIACRVKLFFFSRKLLILSLSPSVKLKDNQSV